MVAKNESVNDLIAKLINALGIVVLVFWGLEFTINVDRHPWWDFNLNHPLIMIVSLFCAGFTFYKFFKFLRKI